MRRQVFDKIYYSIHNTTEFKEDWSNSTGYLNGAAKEQIKEPVRFTADGNRPAFLIPVAGGAIAVFSRYTDEVNKEPNEVIVSNGGDGILFESRLHYAALKLLERVVEEASIPEASAVSLVHSDTLETNPSATAEERKALVDEQMMYLKSYGWIREHQGQLAQSADQRDEHDTAIAHAIKAAREAKLKEPEKKAKSAAKTTKAKSGDGRRKVTKPETEHKAEHEHEHKAEHEHEHKAEHEHEHKAEHEHEHKAEHEHEHKAEHAEDNHGNK